MTDRRAILQQILIDEEALFKSLVERARQIFRLKPTGEIVFIIPRSSITQRQVVATYLIAGLFGKELGLYDTNTICADELSVSTGIDTKTITARLSELRKENIADSPGRGQFSISIFGADKILNEVLEKLEATNQ